MTTQHAQGKVVIRDLIKDARQFDDGIPHRHRDRHAQKNRHRQDRWQWSFEDAVEKILAIQINLLWFSTNLR